MSADSLPDFHEDMANKIEEGREIPDHLKICKNCKYETYCLDMGESGGDEDSCFEWQPTEEEKLDVNVTSTCNGYFLGPIYTHKASRGHSVEDHFKYCPHCGLKLVWKDTELEKQPSKED